MLIMHFFTLLIEPYGIETGIGNGAIGSEYLLLIEPYGIETTWRL